MEKKVRILLDSRVLIALVIIFAGIIILLENLGIYSGISVWGYWPLFPVLIGISLLARPKETRQSLTGWILFGAGILFLLDNLNVMGFNIGDYWPLILILAGIIIIKNAFWKSGKQELNDFIDLNFVLGGGDFRFTNKNLTGGKLSAIMGGGTIDLREADFEKEEIFIDTFTMMGGIEIRVPRNWKVHVHGTPILGGIDNKASFDGPENDNKAGKKLTIKGTAIMGGIEIKN
ncbi:MAG: LiaI-LiaF-like domain-containing protein [Candidatus Aminicenantaceae bacterium]